MFYSLFFVAINKSIYAFGYVNFTYHKLIFDYVNHLKSKLNSRKKQRKHPH